MKNPYVIIVAGGKGTRMNSEVPKQFLEIDGKAVLQLTIERFEGAIEGIRIVTVLPKEHISYWKNYCYERNFVTPQILVQGGFTRFHSVKNALEKIPSDALVAVHDGVRPLVSEELIRTLFTLAEGKGAVVPVTPCVETIKILSDKDEEGLRIHQKGVRADRNVLFGAQTPQVFRGDILMDAYRSPFDTAFTDDASVVEAAGYDVFYTEGERTNIKLTTPEDLKFARIFRQF